MKTPKLCSICNQPSEKWWKSNPRVCSRNSCIKKFYKGRTGSIKKVSEKKRIAIKNGDGEYAFFEGIAAARKPICFVTGDSLQLRKVDGKLDVWCFSHVLAKGPFRKFKLYDKNIVLVRPDIHRKWESRTADMRDDPMWQKKFELHDKLIIEYYAENRFVNPENLIKI